MINPKLSAAAKMNLIFEMLPIPETVCDHCGSIIPETSGILTLERVIDLLNLPESKDETKP